MTIQTKYKAGDYVFISYNKLKDISDYEFEHAYVDSMTLHQDFPLYGIITGVSVSASEGFTTKGVVAKTVETFYKIKILSPSYMRTSVYTSDRYFPEVDKSLICPTEETTFMKKMYFLHLKKWKNA